MYPRIIHAACHWPQVDEKMDENSIRGISEAGPQVRKIGVLKILESGTLITMVR